VTPSKPLITTIIPTYRRPQRLRRAIRSVLAQSYPHFQVFVYDNASGDDTAKVVAEYAASDSRVKYFCRPENIGPIKNHAEALEHVGTPFFSFLSDDDVLLPDMYQVALAGMREFPEAMISAAVTIFVNEKWRVLSVPTSSWKAGLYTPPEGMLAMLQNGHLHWTGMLFRREVIEKVGNLDEEVGNPCDMDFQLRIAAHFPIVVSLDPVGMLVIHSASQSESGTFEEKYTGWLKMIHKMRTDETIPCHPRRQAADMLNERFKTWLSLDILVCIIRGEWETVHKLIDLLQNYFHLTLRSALLAILAEMSRSVPPARVFLKGVRTLKRFVLYVVHNPTSRQLQRSYGTYFRHLELKR
jgi:glycosyltransferase involved in cell wall biosynthesis